MRPTYRVRPRIEALEERAVPATISVVNGNLFVSRQVGPLSVEVQATPGQVTVTDNAKSVTVSGVGSLISITGTNAANSITFVGDTGFNGNVLINAGNGSDTIDVNGPIGGNLTVLGGLGADTITSTTSDVTVGGTANLTDTAGNNTLDLGGLNWTVGRDLSVRGIATFTMGGGNTLSVGGNMTMSALASASPATSFGFDGDVVDIGRSLTVNGYGEADTVLIETTDTFTVNGNVTVNLGSGTNLFRADPLGVSEITGSFYYNGTSGDDTVRLLGDVSLIVGGPATVNLGNGSNLFVQGANNEVSGNLTVNSGNGDISATVRGITNGDLTFKYGNGTNETELVNSALVAGKLIYRGGNTSDTVTLGDGDFTVDMVFGTGANDLTLTSGLFTGRVEGKGTNNIFTQNAADVTDIFFINFP